MMMDVLLEEDEGPLTSAAMQNREAEKMFVTEQAKKLFQLCDHNEKGFVVKMDLIRLDGMIPDVSQKQLEQFFTNVDIAKANYITEQQFVDGIEPLLLNRTQSISTVNFTNDVRAERALYVQKKIDDLIDTEIYGRRIQQQQQQFGQQSSSQHNEPVNVASGSSSSQFGHPHHNRDQYQGVDRQQRENHQPEAPVTASQSSLGRCNHPLTGSLKDQVSASSLQYNQFDALQENEGESINYPFIVENTNTELLTDTMNPMMDIRKNLKFDDLIESNRKATSQVDLRKSIYHPDVNASPGSRSLADELREVGITTNDAPKYEPKSDYSPDRVFKVVFVGDSAVGKTCFLHRFCHNRFKPLFNATIGVDFTVKTIRLDNRVVAMQLWDTAGQERFRSITKQYFRNADGVILMYDVTSEQSFLNVRNWIASVKAGVEETCVMCLVGNKVDLFANDHSRVLTYKHGHQLSEEFDMLFFETSAFTGHRVNDCMRAVAKRLQEREEKQLEDALKLEMNVQSRKRSWCCV